MADSRKPARLRKFETSLREIIRSLLSSVVQIPEARHMVNRNENMFDGDYKRQIIFLEKALQHPAYKDPEKCYEVEAIHRQKQLAHIFSKLDELMRTGTLKIAIGSESNTAANIAEVVKYATSLPIEVGSKEPRVIHYRIGGERRFRTYTPYAPAAGSPET